MSTQSIDHFRTTPQKLNSQLDYLLVDGSSSMQDKWRDFLDATQAYVDGVKAANINSQVILHTFCTRDRDCVQRDVHIDQWQSLRTHPVGSHWGMTPLYDAITLMGRRMRDLDPPRASIVIVTDGDENGSEFTTLDQAKAILDWCRAKGWQVTFIGADFNNAKQGALLGGNPASVIGVAQARLVDAATALAEKRKRYGLYGTDMHFTGEEKENFGGYLTGPSA